MLSSAYAPARSSGVAGRRLLRPVGDAGEGSRARTSEGAPTGAERVLGTLGNVEVVATKGDARSIRIGNRAVPLEDNETVVLRPLTG